MLKLNASFSKKVPAENKFSSRSYHASIECELPDGLSDKQLKDKIHDTFELVRDSVESEIGVVQPDVSENRQDNGHIPYPQQGKRSSGSKQQDNVKASSRHLNYLLDIGHSLGMTPGDIKKRAGIEDISDITKAECSRLIDELKGKGKAA